MIESIQSLLTVGAIILACAGMGRPVLRGLRIGQDDSVSTAVWSISIGFVMWGYLLAVLGLMHLLYVPLLGALTLGFAAWGSIETLRAMLRQRDVASEADLFAPTRGDASTAAPAPTPVFRGGVYALAVIAGCGALLAALAPPTAGDALCYHLYLPKVFLQQNALVAMPYDANATYPLLVEMWYLWALALQGAVAAQLIHWVLGLMLALATMLLASDIVGRQWGWIAGCVVLLVPGISNQMTAPLNDVGLAVWTTLALVAWRRGALQREGPRWFVLSGIMWGGALSTKYVAWVFLAAVGIHALWLMSRRRELRSELLSGMAAAAVMAASIAGLWYVRAAWHHGNPVYPFFNEMLVSQAPSVTGNDAALPSTIPTTKTPLGWQPWQIASAPWQVTMFPQRFGGRGHQLGALFLALLPGLWLCRRLRGLDGLLIICLAYLPAWYLLRQNVRFLFPLIPLLAVALVWVLIELRRLTPTARGVVAVATVVLLTLGAALPWSRARDKMAVALGWERHEDYLARQEPTYLAALVGNSVMGPEAHLLSMDYRGFYFDCSVTRESLYRQATGYSTKDASPAEVVAHLRADGFTHALFATNLIESGIQYNGVLAEALASVKENALDETPREPRDEVSDEGHSWSAIDDSTTPLTQLIHEYTFRDSDGGRRHYRLVKLSP